MINELEQNIKDSIDPLILDFLTKINESGFKCGLIGGVVRDFAMSGIVSKDFDIELRLKDKSNNLLNHYHSLIKSLSQGFRVEEKGFEIYSFKINEFELELTLPRIEIYQKDNTSHKNFDYEFIKDIDYTQGFKRRDFTLNSIMLEFDDNKFRPIDPLNGLDDLKNKILRECSEDFIKDPVRFLRAIRFSTKYDFEISDSLHIELKNMTKDFSSFYLKKECEKSLKPFTFLFKLNSYLNDNELDLYLTQLLDYESHFHALDLRSFIAYCFDLPAEIRKSILLGFGLKTKGLVEINKGNVSGLSKHAGRYPQGIISYYTEKYRD